MPKIKRNILYYCICAIMTACILVHIIHTYFDSDTYFFLSEGRNMMQSGIVPIKNWFSFLNGLKITEQQWLWSVIVYRIYRIGGHIGLYILTVLHAVIFIVLTMWFCKVKQIPKAVGFLSGLFLLCIAAPFLSSRPTFVTVNLLLLQIIFMEKALQSQKWKNLLVMLPISILEINMHAAMWTFHLAVFLAYLCPQIKIPKLPGLKAGTTAISRPPYPLRFPAAGALLTIAGGLVNPYRADAMLYIFRSMSPDLTGLGIAEMNPVSLISVFGILVAAGCIWFLMSAGTRKNSGRFSCRFVYIYAGFLLLGCIAKKNLIFTLLGFFILFLNFCKNGQYGEIYRKIQASICHLNLFYVGITVLMLLVSGCYAYADFPKSVTETDSIVTPVRAVEYLNLHHAEKECRIYTEYNNGAYLGWHGYHGYIDARAEIWSKSINKKWDILHEYNLVLHQLNLQSYQKWKTAYDFDYYIVMDNTLLSAFLECDETVEPVIRGSRYQMFRKKPDVTV